MKRIYIILLCALMLTASGCAGGSGRAKDPELPPKVEPHTVEEGTFDIDAVRSNISINGHHFDLPQILSELELGWSYRLYNRKDYDLKQGSGLAKLYYKGKEMGTASLENCYSGEEDKSIIYSVSVKNGESDIYGIVPGTSTVEDVEKMLGRPDTVDTMDIPFKHAYIYGLAKGSDETGVVRGHFLVVDFDTEGVADFVSVTYSELTDTE